MQALAGLAGFLGGKEGEDPIGGDPHVHGGGVIGLGGGKAELAGPMSLSGVMLMGSGQEGQQAEDIEEKA